MAADPQLRRRVGIRIRTARGASGLSQNALARQINDPSISGGYISRWERGENMPSWPNLQALADALGVSIASLLEEDDDEEPEARAA